MRQHRTTVSGCGLQDAVAVSLVVVQQPSNLAVTPRFIIMMILQRISLLLLLAAVCIRAFHLHRSIIRSNTQLYSEAPQFKNFDDMLSRIEVPVLVDFYAQWCGPCVMMQPVLETLASRLGEEARVAKVDTDKSPRLGSRYQIEALPTLVLFHKGDYHFEFFPHYLFFVHNLHRS